MGIKHEIPVSIGEGDVFDEAQILQSKLNRVNVVSDPDSAFNDLIQYSVDLQRIVQDGVLSDIYRLKEDMEQHDRLGDVMYDLIYLNITSFRKNKIEQVLDENKSSRTSVGADTALPTPVVMMLKVNMVKLLETIKLSFSRANDEYSPVEGIADEVVYISLLAKNIESSMRYHSQIDDAALSDVLGLTQDVVSEDGDIAGDMDDIDDIDDKMKEIEDNLSEVDL